MLTIAGRRISPDDPPFVIAELSGNHGGSLERALALVDAVAASGADAVKLQTYTADTMTLDVDDERFRITDPDSPWSGRHLHDLYEEAHTPWAWHEALFARAREHGLIAFSSPFDASAVAFLEGLDAPCHKIASFEIVDLPLIRTAAGTGRPLIVSTGMATLAEIEAAVGAARGAGCRELAVLRCTSTYPAPPAESDLRTIPDLRERFGCEVGLSDHTLGIGTAIAAVALGATVLEKHVTLDRGVDTVDGAFSLEPHELATLVTESRRAWEALGGVRYGPTASERPSLGLRRSLTFVRDLAAGVPITAADVRALRPGGGLPPDAVSDVVGRSTNRAVRRGEPVTRDLLA